MRSVRATSYWIAILCALVVSLASYADSGPRPNVLLIAIDDLNDWVGVLHGHPQVRTPHLDRLAQRGVLFTNAHCQAPLCNPSRTSVLTGKRPSSTGVYGLSPWFRDVPALRGLVTLPQYFAQHGYRTAATGKIFHAHFGLRPGDAEFHRVGPQYDDGPLPPTRIVNSNGSAGRKPGRKNDWGPYPERDEQKGDYRLVSWAAAELQNQSSRSEPFFLCVGIRLPHVPLFAPRKWFAQYPLESVQLPPVLRSDRTDTPRFSWYLHWDVPEHRLATLQRMGEWKTLTRAYLACVSFIDAQVGRLLQALREAGREDDTLVVLWSDHGWHVGEKQITGKNTLWEESTRVPLMFAGPGMARGTCTQPVELLDIFPSLIELCGLPPRTDLEGLSLARQLRTPAAPRTRPAITTANQDNHAVRSHRWRYIRYADGSEELYDLASDPHEWHNLLTSGNGGVPQRVLEEHRQWLPTKSAPAVAGSRGRIVQRRADGVYWEGKRIPPAAPIPGY